MKCLEYIEALSIVKDKYTVNIATKICCLLLCLVNMSSYCFGTALTDSEDHIKLLREVRQTWEDSKDRFTEIQSQLTHGKIEFCLPLQAYDPSIKVPNSNEVVLLTHEGRAIKGIFKPRALLNQIAECAAFKAARFLGMENMVPPIASRQIVDKKGVVSYYIDVAEDQNPWVMRSQKLTLSDIDGRIDPGSLNNFKAFSFVLGMWDPKLVNTVLVGPKPPYQIMSLDNESLMSGVYAPTATEHFFVCWKLDLNCKADMYDDLRNFKPTVMNLEDIDSCVPSLERFFCHDKDFLDLETIGQKRQQISKRILSFFWSKEKLTHFIGEKGWWLQLYKDIPNVYSPEVTSLSPTVVNSFNALTLEVLRQFFEDTNLESSIFSPQHYAEILRRRDLLLANLH